MSKTVRRIRPFGSGDIPAVQRWLEDMAEKGLLFKECGLLFAKFTRGEPKKMRSVSYTHLVRSYIALSLWLMKSLLFKTRMRY